MEEEKDSELLLFIKNQFEIYKKKNYETMLEYCYSFGLKESEYNQNIISTITPIYSMINEFLSKNNIKYTVSELNKSYKFNIIFKYDNYPTSEIKFSIPTSLTACGKVAYIITKKIIKNKYNCYINLSKYYVNNLLTISFYDLKEAKDFFSICISDEELNKYLDNSVIRLFPISNKIGIYTDIEPYSYLNTINECLCKYFKTISKIYKINIDDFIKFVENLYKSEKRFLKKEMLSFILNSINVINETKNPFELFNYNDEMNISMFDQKDYSLKLNDNIVIFQHNDGMIVDFGTEEYLGLCYSKFYKSHIEKQKNNIYYNYFKNIFYKIFSSRYEDIYKLLNFDDANFDLINTQLITNSCAYFGYKKLNIDFNEIVKIVKLVIEKKYNCNLNIELKDAIENNIIKPFPFNIEYGNKVVKLKNEKLTTIYEYFNDNNVLEYIPLSCVINLYDGSTMSGEKFLKEIYKYIPEYNSFKELMKEKIEFLEYK